MFDESIYIILLSKPNRKKKQWITFFIKMFYTVFESPHLLKLNLMLTLIILGLLIAAYKDAVKKGHAHEKGTQHQARKV